MQFQSKETIVQKTKILILDFPHNSQHSIIFNKFFIIIYFWLCWVCCCMWAFCSCDKLGLLFVVVRGLLIAVASLVVEHGLLVCGQQQLWHAGSGVVACGLQSTGSVVVAHGLSCSAACGIFPDQGWNPCPLRWQADS